MTSVVVTGLLMLVGLVGIVVPVLPGLLLVWLATALWAFEHPNRWAWVVFALCGVVYAVGVIAQYLVPGRRLKDAGVRTSTLFFAVVLAIVLFFVIPIVGAPIGRPPRRLPGRAHALPRAERRMAGDGERPHGGRDVDRHRAGGRVRHRPGLAGRRVAAGHPRLSPTSPPIGRRKTEEHGSNRGRAVLAYVRSGGSPLVAAALVPALLEALHEAA